MKRVIPLFLCLFLVLAGCNSFTGDTATPTHHPDEYGRISITSSTYEYNESSYFRAGSISYKKPATADDETFDDVTLCLYDKEGNVLNGTVIGDLSGTIDSAAYEISADERPHYLTVDHPRFHDYDLLQPLTISWTEQGSYLIHHTSLGDLQNDFPYPRHNETGRCL